MEAYTVLSKLGQGACGSVFLVQGTDGGRFALKRVGIERLSAAERKAILREVQLLSQLKHPNIIGCAARHPARAVTCIALGQASVWAFGAWVLLRHTPRPGHSHLAGTRTHSPTVATCAC